MCLSWDPPFKRFIILAKTFCMWADGPELTKRSLLTLFHFCSLLGVLNCAFHHDELARSYLIEPKSGL